MRLAMVAAKRVPSPQAPFEPHAGKPQGVWIEFFRPAGMCTARASFYSSTCRLKAGFEADRHGRYVPTRKLSRRAPHSHCVQAVLPLCGLMDESRIENIYSFSVNTGNVKYGQEQNKQR